MKQANEFNKKAQEAFFQSGTTLDYDFRRDMLLRFKRMVKRNESKIVEAIKEDFGKSYFETYETELMMIYNEINYMLKNLKKLMKPKRVGTSIVHFYSKSKVYNEPFGSVLIISPWNYPFNLSLSPLVGAIAAGNCAVLKPSEITSQSSKVMKEMIEETFPPEYIAVVEGAAETTQDLIKQDFDYLFFTGSTPVGKKVMKTASETLTPTTLELGGKSPAVVSKDADLVKAAVRIAWGKIVNAGQTCIAPDYVLVHESVKNQFILLYQQALQKFYEVNPFNNDDFPSIVNEKHFERIVDLMDGEDILHGGEVDQKTRKIEPTIVNEPDLASDIMQEEIFGPVLPVVSYESVAETVDIIRNRDKPLAFYLFTESQTLKDYMTKHLSFGGGSINDTLIHFSNTNLPFGGVGQSGMGQYTGKDSFDTFSHKKGMSEKTTLFDIPLRYPPYTNWKLKLMKFIVG